MQINGREIGFFYSVWAHCEYNDWIVKNPNSSYASAIVQKAVIMSKAYNDLHEINEPPLSTKEILSLPKRVYDEIEIETNAAEKRDSERTVVSAPAEKNAESSEK